MVGLPVKKGLSAPAVTTIPEKLDRQWFRNFITNFLVNADIRNVQGLNVQGNVSGNNVEGGSTNVTVSIAPFTATTDGSVPAPGTVSGKFLEDNGVWGTPSGTGTPPGGSNTDIQFNSSGAFGGSSSLTWNGSTLAVTGGVTATTLNATSDPELKQNIKPLLDHAYIVDNIKGYNYEWRRDGSQSIGVLSTEVKEVAPQLVLKIGDHEAVNYNGLVAVLIQEVRELRARVAELENKIGN